jgi:hypothetical protein
MMMKTLVVLVAVLVVVIAVAAVRDWRGVTYTAVLETPGPQWRCLRSDGVNFPIGEWLSFPDAREALAECEVEHDRKHDQGGDSRF